ncbi:MAG: DUF4178 domain-containing protein [Gammaproteobacteria bacterium]|nr:DUF4178 domain-containing protein [Gammaproteobacteria bacterium]
MTTPGKTRLFAEGDRRFNCTGCGALLPRRLRYSKLVVCDNCRSILYLHSDAIDNLGTQAALAEHPSLFQHHHRFGYRNMVLEPLGMVRYGYGRGYWEEWWCLDDKGHEYWISVDEGDFVMEQRQSIDTGLPKANRLKPGKKVTLLHESWTVTELGNAEFQGMKGELPERVNMSRRFFYAHLERPGSRLITLEYDDPEGIPDLYLGEWMDPFEIEIF